MTRQTPRQPIRFAPRGLMPAGRSCCDYGGISRSSSPTMTRSNVRVGGFAGWPPALAARSFYCSSPGADGPCHSRAQQAQPDDLCVQADAGGRAGLTLTGSSGSPNLARVKFRCAEFNDAPATLDPAVPPAFRFSMLGMEGRDVIRVIRRPAPHSFVPGAALGAFPTAPTPRTCTRTSIPRLGLLPPSWPMGGSGSHPGSGRVRPRWRLRARPHTLSPGYFWAPPGAAADPPGWPGAG